MPSIDTFYAQRDNRLIDVPLTGYITNNGTLNNGSDNPAVASLNVNDSKLFMVDTRQLQKRTDGTFEWYLVGVTFPNLAPPRFYPGFEVNIIFNVKDTNEDSPGTNRPLIFRIQKNPAVPLDYDDQRTYIELDNLDYADSTDTDSVYTYGHRTVTLLSTGVYWVIKSSYLNNGPSSIYM
jgi:hypothetical protein